MAALRLPAWLLGAGLALSGPAAADPGSERLFVANCSACHQRNGRGIPPAFPALVGSGVALGEPQGIVAILLNGRGGMPAFGTQLDDRQIAEVASYVRAAWGNEARPVPEQLVSEARTSAAAAAERDLQAH